VAVRQSQRARGQSKVQHHGGPTIHPTIKPTTPLKISSILNSSLDLGPCALPVACQQYGASADARGQPSGNQKWANQVVFLVVLLPSTLPPTQPFQLSFCWQNCTILHIVRGYQCQELGTGRWQGVHPKSFWWVAWKWPKCNNSPPLKKHADSPLIGRSGPNRNTYCKAIVFCSYWFGGLVLHPLQGFKQMAVMM
jgi:hypothetical protein